MVIPLVISLLVGILLRYLQIPILCKRVRSPECHPYLILVEVGFTVGLVFIFISPAGLLLDDGIAVWMAAFLAGLSMNAISGIAALYVVEVLHIKPEGAEEPDRLAQSLKHLLLLRRGKRLHRR